MADDANRPLVELYVKAAADKVHTGSCPTCQKYFMALFVLREQGLIDLVVTTFTTDNPPPEIMTFSNGKHYPLVKVHRGLDKDSVSFAGTECDTLDEIEDVLKRLGSEDMASRGDSKEEAEAEKAFEDLYKKFNLYLQDRKGDEKIVKGLNTGLGKLDAYLRTNNAKFLLKDHLTRADCFILPTLQHILVAGKAYKGFEFPAEFTAFQQYMQDSYDTDAFRESCPVDAEIIRHYTTKAGRPLPGYPKKADEFNKTLTIEVAPSQEETQAAGDTASSGEVAVNGAE